MTKMKRFLAGAMVVLTLLPCFALIASAKNVCSEVSGKSDYDGGVNTVFYVTTKNTKKHSVKMKMTKGVLEIDEGRIWGCGYKKTYDFYEVIVYGKKGNGEYTQISKTNVKNKSSYTISFKGYTDYKIKIYSWKAQTINNNAEYLMHPIVRNKPLGVYWSTIPTWKISKTSGVILCR